MTGRPACVGLGYWMLRTPCWGVLVWKKFVTKPRPMSSGVVHFWSSWFLPSLMVFAHTMIRAPFFISVHAVFEQPPATPRKNGPPSFAGLSLFTKFTQRPATRAFAGLATAK